MKIIITSTKRNQWYKDMIGKVFDVVTEVHDTFGYAHYVLTDTENNRNHFIDDELSLLCLKYRQMGVDERDANEIKLV